MYQTVMEESWRELSQMVSRCWYGKETQQAQGKRQQGKEKHGGLSKESSSRDHGSSESRRKPHSDSRKES